MDNDIKTLRLRRGKEESLDRFHPWVFSGALAEPLPEGLEEGETVRVVSHDGRIIGVGHFQIGSIAVRILDFADTDINGEFFAGEVVGGFAVAQGAKVGPPG